MSQRFALQLPGSTGPLAPETWAVSQDDLPLVARILEMAGVDVCAHDVGVALGSARPVPLTPASYADSTVRDRAILDHEARVLDGVRGPGVERPAGS